jgi:hypothetical protein
MPADTHKNACDGKQIKHLLPGIRTRRLPTINTYISTFLQIINLVYIQPSDVVDKVRILVKLCVLDSKLSLK